MVGPEGQTAGLNAHKGWCEGYSSLSLRGDDSLVVVAQGWVVSREVFPFWRS
jgi:hypothetical protein